MEKYSVTGMSCAACSARIEKAVSAVKGVTSCSVSLLTNSMGVEGTASPDDIIAAVREAGYGAALKKDNKEKAATLYSSMLLRHGVNIKYIIKTAKKVNNNITSFSSAICRVLAKYIPISTEGKCPECGADLIHEGGCTHCSQCSYSKCE